MRVIHLSTSCEGGAGKAALRLHAALIAQGVESYFGYLSGTLPQPVDNAFRVDRSFISALAAKGVTVLNRAIARKTSVLFTPYCTSSSGVRSLKALDTGTVHLHNWYNLITPHDVRNLRSRGLTTVATLHDERSYTGGCHYTLGCAHYQLKCFPCPQSSVSAVTKQRQSGLRMVSVVDGAVCPSSWIREQLLRAPAIAPDHVFKIPNVIPLEVFNAGNGEDVMHESAPPPPRVLWFSNKGSDIVPRAIGTANATLASLGSQPLSLTYVGPSQIAGLQGTRVPPIQQDLELANLYRQADLFLHCSVADNAPNAIAESLCSGTPVMTSIGGGSAELVRSVQGGVLVTDHSVGAWARALVEWSLTQAQQTGGAKLSRRAGRFVGADVVARQHLVAYMSVKSG